jgi:hypothetical protein
MIAQLLGRPASAYARANNNSVKGILFESFVVQVDGIARHNSNFGC